MTTGASVGPEKKRRVKASLDAKGDEARAAAISESSPLKKNMAFTRHIASKREEEKEERGRKRGEGRDEKKKRRRRKR